MIEKTDRELIELAAKAAGLKITRYTASGVPLVNIGNIPCPWDPLTNDGDALRLAVLLKMEVRIFNGSSCAEPSDGNKVCLDGDCPFKTTRRVIVQAAVHQYLHLINHQEN